MVNHRDKLSLNDDPIQSQLQKKGLLEILSTSVTEQGYPNYFCNNSGAKGRWSIKDLRVGSSFSDFRSSSQAAPKKVFLIFNCVLSCVAIYLASR